MPVAVCRECGASLLWATTVAGKKMPLNIGIDPNGNTACRREGPRLVQARQITRDHPLEPGEVPYLAHWATCHRRKPTTTKKPKPDQVPAPLF